MASEQSTTPSAPTIPSWIQAPLFEPVLREIVADYKQTKDFKVNLALNAGENYATVMLRVDADVELNDGSSKTIPLMLKTAHDNDVSREMMKNHNMFEVETIMYREVVPELEQLYKDAGVEIKFGAKSFELATDQPYILLEDLTPTGFKNMNRLEGLDMDHTKAVLKRLAQWHAASAVRVATRGPYKPQVSESFFKEQGRVMMNMMFESIVTPFLKCVQSYDGSDLYYERLREAKDKRVDELYEAAKVDSNEFNVLNHGDCWSNNIMYRHDAFGKIQDTFLIDYQVPRYGSPAQDLYYFLLSSTKYELKIKQFDYFIKYYYDQLIEYLKLLNYTKKLPALKDIHIMLHKYNPWALFASTGVMAGLLLDPNDNANIENFLNENDVATAFKMQMYSNQRYRKHMEMILPWLFNRGAL